MKKQKKTFSLPKRAIECLAIIVLLGVTALAAADTSTENIVYTTKGGDWKNIDDKTWIMDKDGDGETDITLVKNGDQWDYLFKVADPSATYYAWEENVPKGYQIVGKGERQDPATNNPILLPTKKYAHTPNIGDDGVKNGNYSNNVSYNEVVTIPNAEKLHVVITYAGESANYDWACIWEGSQPSYTAFSNWNSALSINGVQKFGGGTGTTKECDIDGDTVTFGFRSDSSGCGNGYGYYAVVTGYTLSDLSITNKQITYEEPEYGNLKLSNVVTGNAADAEQNFRFDILLSTDDENLENKLKGNAVFGDVNFTDGKGMVYLKNDDSVEVKDIPAGIKWKITQTAVDGYKTTITGGDIVSEEINTVTGLIIKDQTTEIIYTNEKNTEDIGGDTSDTSTGSFKVKTVIKNSDDQNVGTRIKYSHTPNIDEDGSRKGNYANNLKYTDVVKIPRARKLRVKITYETESGCDYIWIWKGSHPDYSAGNSSDRNSADSVTTSKLDGSRTTKEFIVEGNTVTFSFVSDGSVNSYYGYYAEISNVADNSADSDNIDNNEEFRFSTALLGLNPQQNYTVKTQREDSKYSHTPNISNDGVQNGNYSNNVSYNEVVTIPNAEKLHVVITYAGESASYDWVCMWEGDHPNYTAYNDSSSAITIDGIKKFGGGTGTTKECDIDGDTVTLAFRSDSSGCGNGYGYYAVITGVIKENTILTANAAGSAYKEFSLRNGQEIEFAGLPIGSKYQIQENSNDYISSYVITDEQNAEKLNTVMNQKENYVTNQSLSTQQETLDEDEHALITFTNSKLVQQQTGSTITLDVEKTWNDEDNAKGLRPDEITVRLYQSTSATEEGDMIATAKLDEASGWKTTFKDLEEYPENVDDEYIYTIKEDPVAGYTSEVTDNGNGKYTLINTLSTAKNGDLKLSKSVDGNGADQNKSFKFTIKLSKDNNAIQGSFALDSDEDKGTKTGSIFFDENGEGTISLKHGESAYITGLPENTKYTVQETEVADWASSLIDGTSWTGTIKADGLSEVKVKNTYTPKLQITVHNEVKGSMGDKSKSFQYELKLNSKIGVTVPEQLEYKKNGATGTLTGENGVFIFVLSHDETIAIKDLPNGIDYEITETNGKSDGYKVTSENEKGTLEADADVSFVNELNGTVPTLAHMNTILPLILVILAIAGAAYVLWKRKKQV